MFPEALWPVKILFVDKCISKFEPLRSGILKEAQIIWGIVFLSNIWSGSWLWVDT